MARKDREEDTVDRLERENRELKAVNRQLQKRLKKVDRRFKAKREMIETKEERELDKAEEKRPGDCPRCKENDITEIDMGVKTYETCRCGFRRLKK